MDLIHFILLHRIHYVYTYVNSKGVRVFIYENGIAVSQAVHKQIVALKNIAECGRRAKTMRTIKEIIKGA